MTHLNAVNIGMNKYCGPAVLSILTGKSTDECARVISSINGKYNIEGVELRHLLDAASRLGFDNTSIPPASTLYGTLVRLAHDDGIYIVTVANHFVAIEVTNKNIYFCDNHTKEPMPAASSARLQQRVKSVNKVFKRREPVQLTSKIVAHRMSFGNAIEILIDQQFTYDMPQHNRKIPVARLKFATQLDLDEFIESISKESEE